MHLVLCCEDGDVMSVLQNNRSNFEEQTASCATLAACAKQVAFKVLCTICMVFAYRQGHLVGVIFMTTSRCCSQLIPSKKLRSRMMHGKDFRKAIYLLEMHKPLCIQQDLQGPRYCLTEGCCNLTVQLDNRIGNVSLAYQLTCLSALAVRLHIKSKPCTSYVSATALWKYKSVHFTTASGVHWHIYCQYSESSVFHASYK